MIRKLLDILRWPNPALQPQPTRYPKGKIEVACSCGETALLECPGDYAPIDFKAGMFCGCLDPSWQYHFDTDGDSKSRYWSCGAPGHYQVSLKLGSRVVASRRQI